MASTLFQSLRRTISALPVVGPAARTVYRAILPRRPDLPGPTALHFESSPQYWDDRYTQGGNSGDGSYGRLAMFKAETINRFVAERAIQSVVEFGSGDGAQLALAKYPSYTGIDVSARAIEMCRAKFAKDPTKQFFHTSTAEAATARADLALSLDVIFHLVEDDIYNTYMSRLVQAGRRFICVYSSNVEKFVTAPHVRHRCFTDWIANHAPSWKLIEQIPNPYPEDPERPEDTSFADFYFFATDRSGT